MTDKNTSYEDLPLYKCHKTVRAFRIEGINLVDCYGEVSSEIAQIYYTKNLESSEVELKVKYLEGKCRCGGIKCFILGKGISVEVDRPYMLKQDVRIGGYYVRYEDGYESYSPAKAFEDGYSLVEGESTNITNPLLVKFLDEAKVLVIAIEKSLRMDFPFMKPLRDLVLLIKNQGVPHTLLEEKPETPKTRKRCKDCNNYFEGEHKYWEFGVCFHFHCPVREIDGEKECAFFDKKLPPERNCGNCKWFMVSNNAKTIGRCWNPSPNVTVGGSNNPGRVSFVDEECGKHEPREEAMQ